MCPKSRKRGANRFGSQPWAEDMPTAGRGDSDVAVRAENRSGGRMIDRPPRVATAAEIPACRAAAGGPRTASALAVCGLLLLGVGLVFGQTAGFGFVNYDDNAGVYDNRLVTGELTLRGVLAVFTQRHVESWAPLTCLSHILVWHLLGHVPRPTT